LVIEPSAYLMPTSHARTFGLPPSRDRAVGAWPFRRGHAVPGKIIARQVDDGKIAVVGETSKGPDWPSRPSREGDLEVRWPGWAGWGGAACMKVMAIANDRDRG
jgi:hypothetical protein